MRTTVTIDDTLLTQAQALSGIRENGPLLKSALQALIQRESALRLARLGGSQPDLKDVPRRRSRKTESSAIELGQRMVLVDSSIWIDHIRSSNSHLVSSAQDEFGRGASVDRRRELACGNLARRAKVLGLLRALPQVAPADEDEVLFFLDRHHLAGKGIGYVDVHLLAAAGSAPQFHFGLTDKRPAAKLRHRSGVNIFPPKRSNSTSWDSDCAPNRLILPRNKFFRRLSK